LNPTLSVEIPDFFQSIYEVLPSAKDDHATVSADEVPVENLPLPSSCSRHMPPVWSAPAFQGNTRSEIQYLSSPIRYMSVAIAIDSTALARYIVNSYEPTISEHQVSKKANNSCLILSFMPSVHVVIHH